MHVHHQLPRAGDSVGLQNVSIELGNGVASVGNAHHELLQRRNISHGNAAAIVVPIDERLDFGEITRPDGALLAIVTGKVFILRTIIHIINAGFDAGHIDLVTGNPTEIGGPGIGVGIGGALADQIGFSIRGVLHVLAKVYKVRRSHFYCPARRGRLAKQGVGRGTGRVMPRLSVIKGVAKSHKRPQDVPVQSLAGVVIGIQQAIGSVVPHAFINKTAARVAPLIRGRVARVSGGIGEFQMQRVVSQDGGVSRGRLFAKGVGPDFAHSAIRPGGVQVPVGGPGGIPRVRVRIANVPPGEGNAGYIRGLLKWTVRRRLGWPYPIRGGLFLRRAHMPVARRPQNYRRAKDGKRQENPNDSR